MRIMLPLSVPDLEITLMSIQIHSFDIGKSYFYIVDIFTELDEEVSGDQFGINSLARIWLWATKARITGFLVNSRQ